MKLVLLAVLTALAPRAEVYVKGHSRAADKIRANLANLTCYKSGQAEESAATLNVDHVLNSSGRSWIVLVLTDVRQKVVWRAKAEEYPWPIPSPLDRLLKNLARSTCPAFQTNASGRSPLRSSPEGFK